MCARGSGFDSINGVFRPRAINWTFGGGYNIVMFTDAILKAAARGDTLIQYDTGEVRVANEINYEAEIGKFDAIQHTAATETESRGNNDGSTVASMGTGISIHRVHPENDSEDDSGVIDVTGCEIYRDNIADDPSEHMDEFTQAIRQVNPSAADLYMQANAYLPNDYPPDRGPVIAGGNRLRQDHTHGRFMAPTNEIPSLGAGAYGWRAPDPYNRNGESSIYSAKFATQPAFTQPASTQPASTQPAAHGPVTSRLLDSIMDKVEFIEADITELRETCDQTSQLCEDIDTGTATVIRQITALVSLVRTLATEMASSAESIRRIEERLNLMEAQSDGFVGDSVNLIPEQPGTKTPTGGPANGPFSA